MKVVVALAVLLLAAIAVDAQTVRFCSASGDPHFKNFEGKRFNIQKQGEFVVSRETSAGVTIAESMRKHPTKWPSATIGVGIGVRAAGARLSYQMQGASKQPKLYCQNKEVTAAAGHLTIDGKRHTGLLFVCSQGAQSIRFLSQGTKFHILIDANGDYLNGNINVRYGMLNFNLRSDATAGSGICWNPRLGAQDPRQITGRIFTDVLPIVGPTTVSPKQVNTVAGFATQPSAVAAAKAACAPAVPFATQCAEDVAALGQAADSPAAKALVAEYISDAKEAIAQKGGVTCSVRHKRVCTETCTSSTFTVGTTVHKRRTCSVKCTCKLAGNSAKAANADAAAKKHAAAAKTHHQAAKNINSQIKAKEAALKAAPKGSAQHKALQNELKSLHKQLKTHQDKARTLAILAQRARKNALGFHKSAAAHHRARARSTRDSIPAIDSRIKAKRAEIAALESKTPAAGTESIVKSRIAAKVAALNTLLTKRKARKALAHAHDVAAQYHEKVHLNRLRGLAYGEFLKATRASKAAKGAFQKVRALQVAHTKLHQQIVKDTFKVNREKKSLRRITTRKNALYRRAVKVHQAAVRANRNAVARYNALIKALNKEINRVSVAIGAHKADIKSLRAQRKASTDAGAQTKLDGEIAAAIKHRDRSIAYRKHLREIRTRAKNERKEALAHSDVITKVRKNHHKALQKHHHQQAVKASGSIKHKKKQIDMQKTKIATTKALIKVASTHEHRSRLRKQLANQQSHLDTLRKELRALQQVHKHHKNAAKHHKALKSRK